MLRYTLDSFLYQNSDIRTQLIKQHLYWISYGPTDRSDSAVKFLPVPSDPPLSFKIKDTRLSHSQSSGFLLFHFMKQPFPESNSASQFSEDSPAAVAVSLFFLPAFFKSVSFLLMAFLQTAYRNSISRFRFCFFFFSLFALSKSFVEKRTFLPV